MNSTCDLPGAGLTVAPDQVPDPIDDKLPGAGPQETVLAGGCFWCVEAVLRRLEGVIEVESGYAGDSAETANYQRVCEGDTGHAEAVRVRYDPERISYGQLLKVFLTVAHDPTQVNRQGNDVGTQYRSAIFYADEKQRELAERYIEQLKEAGIFARPPATTLEPLDTFHPAEAVHQDYAERNPYQPYIVHVAQPKVEKLRRYFGDRLQRRDGEPLP